MNEHDEDSIKRLLREVLPPVEAEPEPTRDLWPAVLKRMDEQTAMPPWFDIALLGGLIGLGLFFPSTIPIFLYYL
jgi:hypothetical protein